MKNQMNQDALQRIAKLISMDDTGFYNEYLEGLTVEELAEFMETFPQFLKEKKCSNQ